MSHATHIDRYRRSVAQVGLLITLPLVVAVTPATLSVPEYPGPGTGQREGTNEVLAVSHKFERALDEQTGLPSGPPVHSPLIVSKFVDQSTPGFFQALNENQTLELVTINFYKPVPDQPEPILFFTIALEQARIVSIEIEEDTARYPESDEIRERVTFTYQRIIWTFHETGESTSAMWSQR